MSQIMTARDEARAKCLEAMADAINKEMNSGVIGQQVTALDMAIEAFNSLNDIVTVNLIEPTDEMHRAANHKRETDKAKGLPTSWGSVFKAMAATGNLINAPREKS